MRKLIVGIIASLLIISILSGCSSKTSEPSKTTSTSAAPATSAAVTTPVSTTKTTTSTTLTPKYGGTMREVSDQIPVVLGYPPELVAGSGEVTQIFYDSFLVGHNKTELAPGLAESYQLASDYTSITFKLRKDVKFHDGSDFNADVAKWNLDNMINDKKQPNWKSVDVVDPYTVRINFVKWQNTMLFGFADGNTTWMVSKVAFDKHGLDWLRQNPVSTGPFKFDSYATDTKLVGVKNPDYWQKGKPYLDRWEVLFVTDPTTQKATMESGGADMIFVEPGKRAADMKALGLNVIAGIVTTTVLAPGTADKTSPWANKTFREAVEYAIDRDAIASGLGYGYLKAPYQIIPRDHPLFIQNFSGRIYDPVKAKKLLADAGYPNGVKTRIIASPISLSKDACTAIQAYLGAVGIEVEMEYPLWPKYLDYSTKGWTNAALINVMPSIGGPNYNATLAYYLSPTGQFFKTWERTDDFLKLYNASMDAPVYDKNLIYAEVNKIYDDVLLVPLYEAGKGFAYPNYVMDGNWLQKSMTPYKFVENIWFNK